jgi:hypothetical protein
VVCVLRVISVTPWIETCVLRVISITPMIAVSIHSVTLITLRTHTTCLNPQCNTYYSKNTYHLKVVCVLRVISVTLWIESGGMCS